MAVALTDQEGEVVAAAFSAATTGEPGNPSRHAATAASSATRIFERMSSSAGGWVRMTPLPRNGRGRQKGTEGCDATPAAAGCQRLGAGAPLSEHVVAGDVL